MPSVGSSGGVCRSVWHPRGSVHQHITNTSLDFNALKGMSRSFCKTEVPMFKLPPSTKQAGKAGTTDPENPWLRGGFCDARPTVVQKVLGGLTKFNSLNKALLGSNGGMARMGTFLKK